MAKKKTYTFIDLFAGIGGFHQAMHSVGMKCVFASEWDKNARISYEANYKDIAPNLFENNNCYFNEDITKQDPTEIPPFDICCGGFPCQPFSIAGLRRGFEDTRGTLFFNIANMKRLLLETDEWLRRRIRMCIWKAWKKVRTRVANLIRCGINKYKAYEWGNTRKGYWRIADSPILKRAIDNNKLRSAGYATLMEAYLEWYPK